MSVEVRAIHENELAACLKLWYTVFDNDPPGYFERYFYADADYQPEYTRVAVDGGQIVSAVQIVKRIVACGGFALTMGGIANVATHPEFRGRGYASECLRQAIEVMKADAIDFSTLGTGIHDFYARLGWEPVTVLYLMGPNRQDLLDRSGKSDLSDLPRDIQVRRYAPGDAEAIQAIYAEFNRDRPITVRRTPQYWRDWIGLRNGHTPGTMLVAESDGRPVGYCCFWTREATIAITEIGAYDGYSAVLPSLIRACASDALRSGVEWMELRVPATPEVRSTAERVLARCEWGEQRGTMVRFTAVGSLLSAVLAELRDRWRRAGGPPGVLSFDGPSGSAQIRSHECGPRVESVDSDGCAALSQADLFGLLVGAGPPEGRSGAMDRVFADAMFPRADGWYWGLDGF